MDQLGNYFILRAKSNARYQRIYSRSVDRNTGVTCDQIVHLSGTASTHKYPDKLRRINYTDGERDKKLVFLTNNSELPALTTTELYKCRWQIQLLFKWIKQHLCIKSFYGVFENAVKTRLWIAVSVYALSAIIRKRLDLEQRLYSILQILSLTLFEKSSLRQVLSQAHCKPEPGRSYNRSVLFN